MKKIGLLDVKQALLDPRFQQTLPDELQTDLKKFLSNPGCACNHPIYRRVMQVAKEQLLAYFPTKDPVVEDLEKVPTNQWRVINCHVEELQQHLRKLGPGRKQLDLARWQDQVTVVINELDE